ncbi:MAG: hypothetical protein ACLFOY_13920 [Desulfatibacillaceae bacterium]
MSEEKENRVQKNKEERQKTMDKLNVEESTAYTYKKEEKKEEKDDQ